MNLNMEEELMEGVKEEVQGKETLCRLCASYTQLLIPIFEGEGLENSLSEKIDKYLPIQVTPSDYLPLQVCFQCASTVISWHELTATCVESERKLKAMFGDYCINSSDVQLSPGNADHENADDTEEPPGFEDSASPSNIDNTDKEGQNLSQDASVEVSVRRRTDSAENGRLQAQTQISFAEYHTIRCSYSTLSLPKYASESSSHVVFTPTSKEEDTKVLEKSSHMVFEPYQDTSSPSDSSDSSDDSYVPPKKLRSAATRKQTRSYQSKKREPAPKVSSGQVIFKCQLCVRQYKRGCDLARHVQANHPRIKDEPDDHETNAVSPCEESAPNMEIREAPSSPSNSDEPVKEINKKPGCQVTCNNCNRKFRTKDALQRHVTGDHCIMNPPQSACIEPSVRLDSEGPLIIDTPANTVPVDAVDVHVKEEEDVPDDEDMKDSDYSYSSEESDVKEKNQRPGPSKEKPIFKCEICKKQFKLKESYTTHSRIHTGEKPFTCHMCGKQFSHSGGLSYHLRHVHMGIKEHPCDICGRKFALKAAMQDHRRIHTGERPYVCDVCGKSFKSKASLYIHSKTHTDQFPHPCEYCSKKFRWRQQLLGHLTTHTGEKKHHCKICNKGFGVRNDLTRHERIHSGQKPFKCSVCSLAFGQKRYLKNHLKSRHGILRMENIEPSNE